MTVTYFDELVRELDERAEYAEWRELDGDENGASS